MATLSGRCEKVVSSHPSLRVPIHGHLTHVGAYESQLACYHRRLKGLESLGLIQFVPELQAGAVRR